MRQTGWLGACAVVLAAIAMGGAGAARGGFFVSCERPGPEAKDKKDVVLVVRISGCIQPKDTVASADAEGLVGGQHKTIHLKIVPLKPGLWGLKRQWADDGVWALKVTGGLKGTPKMECVLVPLDKGGALPVAAKTGDKGESDAIPQTRYQPKDLKQADIDKILQKMASAATHPNRASRVGAPAT